jgi:hypothetical protein
MNETINDDTIFVQVKTFVHDWGIKSNGSLDLLNFMMLTKTLRFRNIWKKIWHKMQEELKLGVINRKKQKKT